MESDKQPLQIVVSQIFSYFQSNSLNFNSINLTKRLHIAISQAGLISVIALTATISNATPPEHANHDYARVTPLGNTSSKNSNAEEWTRGRILVMPRAGLPARAFAEILNEHDGKARKIGQSDLYVVDLPEYSEEGVVAKLQHHPHLKFAELELY